MNKTESRYFQTAEWMDEALLLLIETKDFEYITVKEVCAKAGVNRSTFYLHYESMEDLLEETLELINRRFMASFGEAEIKDIHETLESGEGKDLILISPRYLLPYLNFIRENAKLFQVIHKNPQLFHSEETFGKMYREIFQPTLNKFNVPEEEQRYIFAYYTYGALAVIMEWLGRGCKDPIEKIAELIVRCTGNPFVS